MIDPVIFTIRIGRFELPIHWYAVFIMAGVFIGTYIATRYIRRRGENPEYVWDGLFWAIPSGIVGARIWYVATDILGGSTYYLDDPRRMLQINQGGIHFYGGILFAAVAIYVYTRVKKVDMWLVADAAGPSLLIGQGLARPANFINQELYGPPTDLPWGIPIELPFRIPPWNDPFLYPEETTRFHPTFAYEMIWNLIAGGLLLWISRRFEKRIKPGAVFAGWLILAGVGRAIVESFRPDQPRLPGTDLSYSRIISILMAICGAFFLLIKYEVVRLPFLSAGRDTYTIAPSRPSEVAEGPADDEGTTAQVEASREDGTEEAEEPSSTGEDPTEKESQGLVTD